MIAGAALGTGMAMGTGFTNGLGLGHGGRRGKTDTSKVNNVIIHLIYYVDQVFYIVTQEHGIYTYCINSWVSAVKIFVNKTLCFCDFPVYGAGLGTLPGK